MSEYRKRRPKEHDVDGYFKDGRRKRYVQGFTTTESEPEWAYRKQQEWLSAQQNDPALIRDRALYQSGLAMIQRKEEERRTAIEPPDIKNQYLATWSESLTSADFYGGELLQSLTNRHGFDSYDEAAVWGSLMITEHDVDGGVILEVDSIYFVYSIKSKAWLEGFTRKNIESGFDKLTIDKSEVEGIVCFITKDGYIAPITSDKVPGRPKHIVIKDLEGVYGGSTWSPAIEGYKNIIDERQKGTDLRLSERAGLALFKGMLKATAIERIKKNRKDLVQLIYRYSQQYQGGTETKAWLRLRKIIIKDQELAKKQEEIESAIKRLHLFDGLAGATQYSINLINGYEQQVALIKNIRLGIRKDYPALNTLDTSGISKSTSNEAIYKQMKQGFADIEAALVDVEKQVHEGSIPLFKLGTLIDDVKAQLDITDEKADQGDTISKAALEWLSDKDLTDKIIKYAGTAGTIIFSILAAVKTGGASLLFGALGASTGLGTSMYEFNQAKTLYTVASAQRIGKNTLSNQLYEDAKFEYIMGTINLVLAGFDVGMIGKGVSGLSKSRQAVSKMMSLPGSRVLSQLNHAQINRFFSINQFRRLGKTKQAERTLNTLAKELDVDTLKKAQKFFDQLLLDDIGKVIIRNYDELTAKAFKKMRQLYPSKPVQEHHWIIQAAVSGKKPHDISEVLKRLDIDITKAQWNKAFIPHEGKHTDKYFVFVEEQLDNIYEAYRASGNRWSKSEMEKALLNVTENIKKEIINEKLYMYHLK